MAQINPPKPNPLMEAMAKLLKEKAPGVVDAAEKLTGPENPPVNYAAKLLNAGDPMGMMGMGSVVSAMPKGWTMGTNHAQAAKFARKTADALERKSMELAAKGDRAGAEYYAQRSRFNLGKEIEHMDALTDPVSAKAYDEKWWKKTREEEALINSRDP